MDDIEFFHTEAMYGVKTKKPLVKFNIGSEERILTTKDAKKFAYDILDCAHAADGDAFMVHYLQEKVGISEDKAIGVLVLFRDERVRMNGEN